MLAALYVLAFVLGQIALPRLALLGIADAAFGLRLASGPAPPDPAPPAN